MKTKISADSLYDIAIRARSGDCEDWENLTPEQQNEARELLADYELD